MTSTLWIIIAVFAICVLLCFLLSIANHSGERFLDRYEEVDKLQIRKEITPLQFVDEINAVYFKKKLKVVEVSELASDAYSKGNLFLSWKTLKNPSIASFTIIAHEMGHALQDQSGQKLKKLNRLRKIGKIVSCMLIPSLIAGGVLLFLSGVPVFYALACFAFGAVIFLLSLFIKLKTISIEKDASKKAIMFLQEILNEEEIVEAKNFLKDAKLTYWADFLRIFLWWTGMSRKTKMFN